VNVPVPSKRSAVNGVVILDKPTGPTSFDIVAQVRRVYGTKAVGHAGTLDPLATGVLVVMLGEATKLSEYLTTQDKEYIAEIAFGRSTDTFDCTGETIAQRPLGPGDIARRAIDAAVAEERSRQWQVPPEHSAIKVAGQPSYALARRGESVPLAPRKVAVSSLTIQSLSENALTLSMRVSKGYYVRALVRDLCERLNVPGCMSALRRTASGNFRLAECAPWPLASGALPPPLISVSEAACRALPKATLTSEGVVHARQGKRLSEAEFEVSEPSLCAWLDSDGKLVALGEHVAATPEAESYFRVIRGFSESSV
jgi:tRNA pseudouridine55 synthase